MTTTTASDEAVERTYLLLRHASMMLLRADGEDLDTVPQFGIASLHLEVLALVPRHRLLVIEHPATLTETVELAAQQTAAWDHSTLSPESKGVAAAIAEIRQAITDSGRP
ncbi:hypothetical protein LKO27_03730 [Tessaracoccus sp. OS52]|uniref:hypothetical protein n=1 Tax=Tessaracoccus sp. OS52 TaxID=2886691 RepID=UPI001D1134B8|nr:hypothetical protein [Tessaracoccus sp. OS52]MCC2592530.1 hypothetical protein [Tessaracoccus sp. OS52]